MAGKISAGTAGFMMAWIDGAKRAHPQMDAPTFHMLLS
jgi:hypothetical protein